MHTVVEYGGSEIDFELAMAIVQLKLKVWPKPNPPEELAKRIMESATRDDSQRSLVKHFAIWGESTKVQNDSSQRDSSQIELSQIKLSKRDTISTRSMIGHAQTFLRTVKTEKGNMQVLALAAVCADPEIRGQGLGKLVVEKAFSQVEEGVAGCSLFQTGVQQFYEKLNCRVINNRLINSLDEEKPDENPFWDKCEMIHPANFDWPEGTIDLLGPGY